MCVLTNLEINIYSYKLLLCLIKNKKLTFIYVSFY